MTVPLGRLAEVNPPVPEFAAQGDSSVSFVPLECVWPDGKADFSRRRLAKDVSSGYTLFRRGDVLVPKITPTFEAGRVAVANISTDVGAGTTELHVIRPRPAVDARFLTYVCRSQPFLQDGATRLQGVGNLRRVPAEFLEKFPVAVADPEQQRAIADYLDREIAQIDTLIEEQQRLLALLDVRRAAVISAGTGWGNTLPQGWDLKRISWLFSSTASGTTPPNDEILDSADAEVPWVTTSELRENIIDATSKGVARATVDRLSALRIHPAGSVLVAMYGATIGRTALLAIDAASNQACCALVNPQGVRPRFVELSLRAARKDLLLLATGGGQPNINQEKLRSFRIPVPPLAEQDRVVARLDGELARLSSTEAAALQLIELSRERRAALITAAVTGQIDIKSAA